jgi:hypothetical protein
VYRKGIKKDYDDQCEGHGHPISEKRDVEKCKGDGDTEGEE